MRKDVGEGFVSADAAAGEYGVAVEEAGANA
jgi:hypothetical protein